MIEIRAIRSDWGGYTARTEPEYGVLGMWLDEADEADFEALWRDIGARTRGECARLQRTNNDITIVIDRDVKLFHFGTCLELPLLEFALAAESWLSVVAPSVAVAVRQIRDSWA